MKRIANTSYTPFYESFVCFPIFSWAKCEFCACEFKLERGMGFRIQTGGKNKYACANCCGIDYQKLDNLVKKKFFTHGLSGPRRSSNKENNRD